MANYAFIDSQNVHLAIRDQGWVLDWKRFRQYLRDKYDISTAFVFIGYVPGKESLYARLQQSGFIVIHKPTLEIRRGRHVFVKGNVDAELVLHAMIQWKHYEKAIIVSGDGDFHCLIEHLERHNKLLKVMIPNPYRYSGLLRTFHKYIAYMHLLRSKIEAVHTKTGGSTLRTEP
jgi:uncharacterized LabA/DUF88 family protein